MERFSACFRFHGFLNAILTRPHQAGQLTYQFSGSPAVKDAIEACGIPHTEVNQILLNDRSVTFRQQLQDGDLLEIYPYDCPVERGLPLYLCPAPESPLGFILDVHLGKLARRLRLLGFDCLYRNDFEDSEIIKTAIRDRRVILTRDRGILKYACVDHGLLIRSVRADDQVNEVLARFQLHGEIIPLSRCPLCNGTLRPVEKQAIESFLLPKTARYYQKFHQCVSCGKVYWQGAHQQNLAQWIARTAGRTK